MTKRFNRWLFAFILILGTSFYWLLLDNRPGDAAAKPITIAELRRLASSKRGELPNAIRFEAVGRTLRMGNLSAAGTGLRFNRIFILVFAIQYEAKPPIVIGSGLTRSQADRMNFMQYDSQAQARVFQVLRKARRVITLGRKVTQTGGLMYLKKHEPKAKLHGQAAKGSASGHGDRPYAVAPGVVIIPTPDRMPGSKLVYARLANGREYLFAGNLSRTARNWLQVRVPGRLITDFVQPENRQESFSWLLTLRKLKRESPGLVIVSGNKIPKYGEMIRYFDAGPGN